MSGTAMFFWVAMAAAIAVAVILGRWQTEDMTRRIVEIYGHHAVKPRADTRLWRVSSRGMESPDAAFPRAA